MGKSDLTVYRYVSPKIHEGQSVIHRTRQLNDRLADIKLKSNPIHTHT